MSSVHGRVAADGGEQPLPTRALNRESTRVRQFLATGQWCPTEADVEAVGRVLARLTAPLPARGAGAARARAVARDRRLQRTWRTAVHHLDAGAVSAPTAALLAAVARAFLPWNAFPTPPVAAAAARYASARGTADRQPAPPTEAAEALLPDLVTLFAAVAAATPAGPTAPTPPAVTWQSRHRGKFRHYGRPGTDVWTADTFRCPGCGSADGPWTVSCDWRMITLCCSCGQATGDHGLTFSEVWLLLRDV